MITELSFKTFKALEDVTLTLERLTVLVGANGTGKSSVLQGLEMLGRVADVPASSRYDNPCWEVEGDLRRCNELSGRRQGRFTIQVASSRHCVAVDWNEDRLDSKWELAVGPIRSRIRIANSRQWRELDRSVLREFQGVRKYAFDHGALAAPHYSEDEVPVLHESGAGLPSVLAHLTLTDPAAKQAIDTALARVVPHARATRLPRSKVQLTDLHDVWGHRLEVQFDHLGWVPAEHVSEGTLLALGILTTLHQPTPVRTLLLDDLDRGLHPTAQLELVQCLRRILDERADLQIVATTHSPYLLDCLHESEVRVMALNERNMAMSMPLSDHPQWSRWKDHMQVGEFWSSVGEAWVAEAAGGG